MNDLTPEQLAWARKLVADETARGTSQADIDGALQQALGVGSKDVMAVKPRDVARAALMGSTGGFLDEANGLLAKVAPILNIPGVAASLGVPGVAAAFAAPQGKTYEQARDDVRNNFDASKLVASKTMTAADLAGGTASAIANAPLMAGGEGLSLMQRVWHAMKTAGLLGSVEGAGRSTATDPAGVAKDAAISGGVSSLLGPVGELAGSAAGKTAGAVVDAVKPSRAIVREAATQIPADAATTIARQEALAPGTSVIASLSPELRALTRGVGADAETGVAARTAAEARADAIKVARKALGPKYEALQQDLPVDDDLRQILSQVKGKPLSGETIDFKSLQKIRTRLLEDAATSRKPSIKAQNGTIAGQITDWLSQHIPELKGLDKDYAFLSGAKDAADEVVTEATNSSKNYAANRAYGAESGSIGGSLPHGPRGLAQLAELFKPDRAARARAVNSLLLTPGDATADALSQILKARARMTGSQTDYGRAILNGLLAPYAGSQVPGLLH